MSKSNSFPLDGIPEIFRPWENKIQAGTTRAHYNSGGSSSLAFQDIFPAEQTLKSRKDFCQALRIPSQDFTSLQQIHSDTIHWINHENRGIGSFRKENALEGDGMITNEKNVPLVVFAADCVPLLFYDPVRHCAAAVHGGWKGTYQEIAGKCIERMNERFQSLPEDVRIWMGPSIGSCCYEVSFELAQQFSEKFPESREYPSKKEAKDFLDLKGIHKLSLLAHGVKSEHISISEECTFCGKGDYPSYRKEKSKAGRMSAYILLK